MHDSRIFLCRNLEARRGGQTSNVSHPFSGAFFLAILAGLSTLHARSAQAQAAGNIEQTFAGSLTALPAENLAVTGAFYVPVYSSVSMSQGKLRADFSVTLSIHNASETRPLVLKRIAYFDTAGQDGGKLPQGAGRAETVLHRRGFHRHHRRARRHRRQFRGRLGGKQARSPSPRSKR